MKSRTRLPWIAAVLIIALLGGLGYSSLSVLPHGLSPNAVVVPAGLSGTLLYTRDRGLWTLALETGRTSQIVVPPDPSRVTSARWSPDGTRVAYAFIDALGRVTEIRIASLDGSAATTVLSWQEGALGLPVWASDAAYLYFARTGAESGRRFARIERLDLATGATERVLDAAGSFDVSRDGRWLALARGGSATPSILLLDLESGEQRTVVEERTFDTISAPRFDSRSRTVLFGAAALPADTVPSSLGLDRLLGLVMGAGRAYAHGLPQDVYAVPVAGGPMSRIAAIAADDPVVAPSPDGAYLAILSAESPATLPVVGGSPTPILTPGGPGAVDWSQ